MGEVRNAYEILIGKPKGNRPLGRLDHKLDNIKMNLRETGLKGVEWMHVAQNSDR
jgi:hypothetical protein